MSYGYDGDGKRVEKVGSEIYWYGLGSEPLMETDWSGNLENEYVFIGGKRIARRDASGNVYYYLGDDLGTSRVIATSSGTKCYDADFGPYGQEDAYLNTCPQNYKFTGKERDAESGNDYFGARYYASTMGRFLSPDWAAKAEPVPYAKLDNPQNLNLYSYVENNPLNTVDTDGHERLKIVYRAFIPQKSIHFMGRTYAGDNRGFSTVSGASSRTTITVLIETDPSIRPGNPIISQTSSAGQSRQLNANGDTINSATATQGLPTATGSRDANGDAVVNITQDVKNPLSPVPQFMTPGITANLNVSVTPNGSTVSATGTASNFPSEELNVTGPSGATTPVFQFTPSPGSSPFSLFLPDRNVNATAHPCQSGQSGCSP